MRAWWENSCDDIIAVIMKLVENYGGPYSALCILGAIIFPIATIVAGTGYSILWGITHFLIFAIMACAMVILLFYKTMIPPSVLNMMTPRVLKVIVPLGILVTIILSLGILNVTKPIAVVIGLLLSQIGLAYLMLVGSGVVLIYGIAVAITPAETVGDAQKRISDTWKHFIGVAAWECFVAWYIVSFGQYMSIYTGAFLICAAGVVLYGGIAWGIGGDFGRKAVYYIAVAGVIAVTTHTILMAVGYLNPTDCINTAITITTDTTTTTTKECTPYQWIYWQGFLSNAVNIHDHTLEWFVAITVLLAIGFMVSKISGKKTIQENVRLATFLTVGIFSAVWLIWFNGYANLFTWFIKLGQGALPAAEVWHGVIRLLVIILIIPALAIRFQRGGFRGFTMRLLWIIPCVLLPWFLFEKFLWEWYPAVVYRLQVIIDSVFLRMW